VVELEHPINESAAAGNVTLHGVAVDCTTGVPASRVAVYDGIDASAAYVGDVSMDSTRPLEEACMGKSGSSPIGFTIIFDSHRLEEGAHSLTFVATYPSGSSTATTDQIFVENFPPREPSDNSNDE